MEAYAFAPHPPPGPPAVYYPQIAAARLSEGASMMGAFRRCSACTTLAVAFCASTVRADDGKLDFNRHVRPILSDKCFACHGPDTSQVKGKLRLDVREVALKREAIVPGKADKSLLVERIHSVEAGRVMPPRKSNKILSDAEKQILKRWIEEGAEYKVHWAFATPKQPSLPMVKQRAWPRNPIDHFILSGLEKAGLQ